MARYSGVNQWSNWIFVRPQTYRHDLGCRLFIPSSRQFFWGDGAQVVGLIQKEITTRSGCFL